ncbi:MAG TPA: ABC transporter substrate-binding protein [Candidatus Lustribacter sp.]|nr:ABC transporter substrate-binding protein [Candidatus Lustribacter sp.]
MNREALLRSVFAGAAGSAVPRLAAAQTRAAVHVATLPVDADATAWFASDQGYFAQNGLDVAVDIITNGGAIISGVMGGALDVGVCSIGTLATAHARGLPIVALAPGGVYNGALPTTVLAVAQNSPLRTAKDLTGRTIAIQTLGETASFSISSWIDRNGGDAKSVKFVEIPTSSMADALEKGRVDAAFIAEPFYTQAKPAIRFFAPAYDGVAKRFLISAWCARQDWIERNPDVARKFVAAMRTAAVWGNQKQNLAASGVILGKYTHIDPETIAKMQRAQFALTLDPAMLQPVIDVSAQFGVIPKPFPAAEVIAKLS